MKKISLFIRKCWKDTDCKHFTMNNWRFFSNNLLPKKPPKPVISWTIVLDEILNWLICYNIVMQFHVFRSRSSTDLEKCTMIIGSTIISICLSLRKLTNDGYDVSARHVVRCLREYIDVLSLVSIKTDLCKEFIETQDEKSSNEFWHKYISKGKAQKIIFAHRHSIFPGDYLDEMSVWRKQEEEMMAMASHPSYAAGGTILLSSVMLNNKDGEETYNPFSVLGVKNELVVRPLKYAIYSLIDHIIDCKLPKISKKLSKDHSVKPFIDHVKSGLPVVLQTIQYAFENEDDEEFGIQP